VIDILGLADEVLSAGEFEDIELLHLDYLPRVNPSQIHFNRGNVFQQWSHSIQTSRH
jgi:hypothetical protein